MFEQYAAQLMEIDLDELQKKITTYNSLTTKLEQATDEADYNTILLATIKDLGIKLPWDNHTSFDDFMKDDTAVLVFE